MVYCLKKSIPKLLHLFSCSVAQRQYTINVYFLLFSHLKSAMTCKNIHCTSFKLNCIKRGPPDLVLCNEILWQTSGSKTYAHSVLLGILLSSDKNVLYYKQIAQQTCSQTQIKLWISIYITQMGNYSQHWTSSTH